MCGIAGFIGRGEERDLLLMQKNILHRGPDQQGIYFKEGVGLAHTRLAIIDTDPRGVQPMWNEKKTLAIVFNGEIYNYRALRDELKAKGKSFSTETDTEVLLTLFEEMGEACFQKLDGMFALAFYDAVTGNVILARDRMGEKPLYYGLFDRTVIFASELPAVLSHPFVKKELDPVSLAAYMVREYVPTPRTMFKNIYKVESGHYIKVVGPRIEKTSFWQQEVMRRFPDYFLDTRGFQPIDDLTSYQILEDILNNLPLNFKLAHRSFARENRISELTSKISELKKAGLKPQDSKDLAKKNKADLEDLNDLLSLIPLEIPRAKAKATELIQSLVDYLQTKKLEAEDEELVPSLKSIILKELTSAVTESFETNKTTPITAFKNSHLEKDSNNNWRFKDTKYNQNLEEVAHIYEQYEQALQQFQIERRQFRLYHQRLGRRRSVRWLRCLPRKH
jgi:hypothetical protein